MPYSKYASATEAYEDYRLDAMEHGEPVKTYDEWLDWLDDVFKRVAENAAFDQYEERRYHANH